MVLLFYLTLCLLLVYGSLIYYYKRAWQQMPEFIPTAIVPSTKITVIIPARNEEESIGHCLTALLQQSYPRHLTEIIVVNDYSTDGTAEKVRNHPAENVRLINLIDHLGTNTINSYKKKAIEVAIAAATGDLIITTDADCTAPPGWISCMAAFQHQYQAAFIAAPVRIIAGRSLLSVFQTVDFMTLQGITGAAVYKKFHSMCNGANLAYQKKAFYTAGGFTGIDDIASGDDMMLMHKIARRNPNQVFYLKSKEAIVSTLPAASWKDFFRQRIRWASKADKYDDRSITAVLVLVYGVNVLLLFFMIAGVWNTTYLKYFLLLLLFKFWVEYFFVRQVALFFEQRRLMVYFIFLQPLHIVYTVIAGWLGKFGHYEWKSRKVR